MMNTAQIIFGMVCGVLLVTAVIGEPVKPETDIQKECTFEKTITKKVQGSYLLYLPQDYDKEKNKRWPLVMFLHGMGERGSELNKVKLLGPPRQVADGKQFPFILISPQCPDDSFWDSETDMLTAMLDEVEAKYRVDKSQVLLTGLSMGGYGTWALSAKQPSRFAAIAPICGGGNPKNAPLIKDIPMWVFHGDKDDVVKLSKSQEMVDAVKAAGGNPKFTVYPGVGHDAWTATYNDSEFWKWFLGQRRK